MDYFLFESGGYCNYFASAMAVMARSLRHSGSWWQGMRPGITAPRETSTW